MKNASTWPDSWRDSSALSSFSSLQPASGLRNSAPLEGSMTVSVTNMDSLFHQGREEAVRARRGMSSANAHDGARYPRLLDASRGMFVSAGDVPEFSGVVVKPSAGAGLLEVVDGKGRIGAPLLDGAGGEEGAATALPREMEARSVVGAVVRMMSAMVVARSTAPPDWLGGTVVRMLRGSSSLPGLKDPGTLYKKEDK